MNTPNCKSENHLVWALKDKCINHYIGRNLLKPKTNKSDI